MMENQSKMHTDKPIPAGFKLTEVGVIPEDWAVEQLSMITEPKRPISYGIVQTGPSVVNGIPCIRVVDISNGKIQTDNLITTSEKISASYRRTILQKDDVLIPLRGKVGEIAIVDKYTQGANLTRGVALIAPKSSYDSRYVKQYLSCKDSADRFLASMNGSALQEITIATLRHFYLALPSSLEEQIAIGNVLSDTDILITELEKLIGKKQAIKTATMQQLLTGRTRLSQFSKHSDGTPKDFTSSELGLIPEDWILSPMSQMGHILRGVSYNGSRDLFPHDTDGSVRLFRSNNIYNSKIDLANLQYVNKNRVAHHQLMNSGDILICMANGSKNLVGKAAIYNIEESHKYTFGAFMGVFRTFPEVESLYAFYLLTSDRCRSYIDLALAGSSINNLKPSDIEQFTFALPNSEEQKAIVSILSDMDAELEVLERKLSKVRDIKQGMMQQLLTGRIRLPLDQLS